MVFLPEAFDFVGESTKQTMELAEDVNGPTIDGYRSLAKELDIYLSLGGFHNKIKGTNKVTKGFLA